MYYLKKTETFCDDSNDTTKSLFIMDDNNNNEIFDANVVENEGN